MIKVHIADDEEHVRDSLVEILKLYGDEVELSGVSDSVSSTIAMIQQTKPHILLLDIEIIGGTAFDVLKEFPRPEFKVIFVTAHEHYAIKAFRFSALDYLPKPVDPEILISSIKRARGLIERETFSLQLDSLLFNMSNISKQKKIILRTQENIHLVTLQDIMYCEADRNYTNFYLVDKNRIMVSCTLVSYEEMFSEYGFLRVHQSFLVNVNYIKRFDKTGGGKIILLNDIVIPVASRKKEYLIRELSKL